LLYEFFSQEVTFVDVAFLLGGAVLFCLVEEHWYRL